MRLDKYLKVSRVIKRRTVANDACDAGHISVNGKVAKASYDVKEGDIIEVSYGGRTLKLRVNDVREHALLYSACSMYASMSERRMPPICTK